MTFEEINTYLRSELKKHIPLLKIIADTNIHFEVHGTIPAMQGRREVDGIYFASIASKPDDIRFYFFPIYTNVNSFRKMDPSLKKYLKGKSCFHFKKGDVVSKEGISSLIQKGIDIYKREKII